MLTIQQLTFQIHRDIQFKFKSVSDNNLNIGGRNGVEKTVSHIGKLTLRPGCDRMCGLESCSWPSLQNVGSESSHES
jgi:hypothetical protein